MFRVAELMAHLGEPWPDVQDALTCRLGHSDRPAPSRFITSPFTTGSKSNISSATCSPSTPPKSRFLKRTTLFVNADVYTRCAIDERAVCASWIGKHAEAFTLCSGACWPAPISPTASGNGLRATATFRCRPTLEAASSYPDVLAGSPWLRVHATPKSPSA